MLTDLTAAVLMVLVALVLYRLRHLGNRDCQSDFVEPCCAADRSVP
jgi:hypothetical protein